MPQTTKIVITIEDQKKKQSTITCYIPFVTPRLVTTPGNDPVGIANELAYWFSLYTGGVIKSCNVIYSVDIPGINSPLKPTASSDVEEGMQLTFKTENGYTSKLRIPTFDENYLTPEGGPDPSLQTFFDTLLNFSAYMGGTVDLTDSRGDKLTSITMARESFKAR